MQMLIVPKARLAELAALNKQVDLDPHSWVWVDPCPLASGDGALPPGLLNECAPGHTWERFSAFLQSLAARDVAPNEFQPIPDWAIPGKNAVLQK